MSATGWKIVKDEENHVLRVHVPAESEPDAEYVWSGVVQRQHDGRVQIRRMYLNDADGKPDEQTRVESDRSSDNPREYFGEMARQCQARTRAVENAHRRDREERRANAARAERVNRVIDELAGEGLQPLEEETAQ